MLKKKKKAACENEGEDDRRPHLSVNPSGPAKDGHFFQRNPSEFGQGDGRHPSSREICRGIWHGDDQIATFNSAPVAVSSFGIALPENLLPFPMAGCSIMNDCLDMDDRELLTEYATRNSEDAFRTLVERHAGFVYHTALRQVGNHLLGRNSSPGWV